VVVVAANRRQNRRTGQGDTQCVRYARAARDYLVQAIGVASERRIARGFASERGTRHSV
jgi:hypothetical protein